MTNVEEQAVRELIKYASYWCGGSCAGLCPKHKAVLKVMDLLKYPPAIAL